MRYNRFVSLLLVFSLVASASAGVSAQSDQPAWAQETFDEFSGMVDMFNAQVSDVDFGPAEGRLAGKTANVFVESSDGTATMSFSMNEQQQITDLSLGTVEDADIDVRTDRETLDAIVNSENPPATFRDAYQDGRITIKSSGGFVGSLSSGRIVDWAFWTAADLFKSFF